MDAYSSLLNLNFMTSLRTDNILLDMCIALLIPFMTALLTHFFAHTWPSLIKKCMRYSDPSQSCTLITCERRARENSRNSDENIILQESIFRYVSSTSTATYPFGSFEYKRQMDQTCDAKRTLGSILQSDYSLATLPRMEAPVSVSPDLIMTIENVAEKTGKEKNNAPAELLNPNMKRRARKTIVELLSTNRHECGPDNALSFITEAFTLYKMNSKAESSKRYLFIPFHPKPKGVRAFASMPIDAKEGSYDSHADEDDDAENSAQTGVTDRYLLGEEKTFDSLFFPQKAKLLTLLRQFTMGTGKFAVPGFARKLTLLLHGPPGTGKTSLIKAIAAYTRRHIFSIDLSHIQTNHQLTEFMYSNRIKLLTEPSEYSHSEYKYVTLQPHEMVYVLEDIDAAMTYMSYSSGVPNGTCVGEDHPRQVDRVPGSMHRAMHSHRRDTAEEKGQQQEQGEERDATNVETTTDVDPCAMETCSSRWSRGGGEEEKRPATASTIAESQSCDSMDVARRQSQQRTKNYQVAEHESADSLNIQGVMNALSGMYDCPERIVILTTNHVEHLHPALLQPGVVTMTLHMDVFTPDCAMEMIRHYFDQEIAHGMDRDAQILAEMRDMLGSLAATRDRCFSPAEIEHLCAEHNTLEELLNRIKKGRHHEMF